MENQQTKTSHVFGRRRLGAQQRFTKEYLQIKDEILVSWCKDLEVMEQQFKLHMKSNQALAHTAMDRKKHLAEETAKQVIATVFDSWRAEINRIISQLNGYPQDDGMILFPDGSTARMPKGLFIPKEQQLVL